MERDSAGNGFLTLVSAIAARAFNYLPGSIMPVGIGPTPPQGYGAALIVALLWMASFIALSAVVFRRHDVFA